MREITYGKPILTKGPHLLEVLRTEESKLDFTQDTERNSNLSDGDFGLHRVAESPALGRVFIAEEALFLVDVRIIAFLLVLVEKSLLTFVLELQEPLEFGLFRQVQRVLVKRDRGHRFGTFLAFYRILPRLRTSRQSSRLIRKHDTGSGHFVFSTMPCVFFTTENYPFLFCHFGVGLVIYIP